jgi:hypothetical protein
MRYPLLFALLVSAACSWAQGAFVGPAFKPLIGKVYLDPAELSELAGFTSRGGSMLSDINDPEIISGSWFSKGATVVAIVEKVNEDNSRQILDVIEISKVKPNQELKIAECRAGEAEMPGIVALVTTANTERVKAIKAWNFNREKGCLEVYPAGNVSCLGMVGD